MTLTATSNLSPQDAYNFAQQLRYRSRVWRAKANPGVFMKPKEVEVMMQKNEIVEQKPPPAEGAEQFSSRNPRVDCSMELSLEIPENGVRRKLNFQGLCYKASRFGGNVSVRQISEKAFWSIQIGEKVTIQTLFRQLPGEVNAVFELEGKFCLGIKLLDGHTWYD